MIKGLKLSEEHKRKINESTQPVSIKETLLELDYVLQSNNSSEQNNSTE